MTLTSNIACAACSQIPCFPAPPAVHAAGGSRCRAWHNSPSLSCRHGIDDLCDFRDLARRKAAEAGMLVDRRLALGQIDTEGLVGSDVGVDPLRLAAELRQGGVGLARRALELGARQGANAGDVPLDDIPLHDNLTLMSKFLPPPV